MEQAGHKCVGFCEWDKYAAYSYRAIHLTTKEEQKELLVLENYRQGQKWIKEREEMFNAREWHRSDIRSVRAADIPESDMWCFGAPCQDFSVAGARAGLDGDRSSLVRFEGGETFIMQECPADTLCETPIFEYAEEVLPESVGQFVMEVDGIKYWEGDIVWDRSLEEYFVIKWHSRQGAYMATYKTGSKYLSDILGNDYPVAGNITQHPELVEGD